MVMGVFVWDYFDKELLFSSKKSVFVYLDNFLKIIRISKKYVSTFLYKLKRVVSEKKINF